MITRFTKALFAAVVALMLLTLLAFINPRSLSYVDPWTGHLFGEGGVEESLGRILGSSLPPYIGTGAVIMPKLRNETAKADLGRATWKLMHTMTLRFPEHPLPEERAALTSYLYLTARLYPCGECAEEFQILLKKFPPQTSSKRSVSLWLCHLHNEVNKRLGKSIFDCARLSEEYDCGCGDSEEKNSTYANSGSSFISKIGEDDVTGASLIRGGR